MGGRRSIVSGLLSGVAQLKGGYAKLTSCCRLAASEGYKYVWIDTCCIDKSSSAELTEAINSMYQWYQQAEVCYAYLRDVSVEDSLCLIPSRDELPKDPGQGNGGFNTDDESAAHQVPISFSESVWCMRGWTLQELIAPRSLQFLDKNWRLIASRYDIAVAVSRITKIPADVLTHTRIPQSHSVAERLSWAADRETTRIEDRVYSLLGLFDVSLPPLYGEGRRAFRRLQVELLGRSDDMTLLLSVETDYIASALDDWVDSFKKSYNNNEVQEDLYRHSSCTSFLGLLHGSDTPWSTCCPDPFLLTNAGVIATLSLLPWTAKKFLAPVMVRTNRVDGNVADIQCIILQNADRAGTTMQRTYDDNGSLVVGLDWTTSQPQIDDGNDPLLNEYRFGSHAVKKRVLILDWYCPPVPGRANGRYAGATFEFYYGIQEPRIEWTPDPNRIFMRTARSSGHHFVPHHCGTYELALILLTEYAGREWYICCGLDLETNPFCMATTKLAHEDKLTSFEPESVTNEDLGWILHTKAYLDMATAKDFEGEIFEAFIIRESDSRHWRWKFPTQHSDKDSLSTGAELPVRELGVTITKIVTGDKADGSKNDFKYKYEISVEDSANFGSVIPLGGSHLASDSANIEITELSKSTCSSRSEGSDTASITTCLSTLQGAGLACSQQSEGSEPNANLEKTGQRESPLTSYLRQLKVSIIAKPLWFLLISLVVCYVVRQIPVLALLTISLIFCFIKLLELNQKIRLLTQEIEELKGSWILAMSTRGEEVFR